MKKILTLALLSAVASSGAIANAATLIVDGSGKLTGASGVTVGTKKYDVAFKDGTCAQVYGTCETRSFAFTTAIDATTAAQALLDQVFINGPLGQFDSQPALTNGCNSTPYCNSFVAYSAYNGSIEAIYASNATTNNSIGSVLFGSAYDTAMYKDNHFARFTLATESVTTAVPEPASWAMMIGGFWMVGGSMRRRKTTIAFA